ncbi:uncharacterized protein LOC129571494 [Sitodiplosis mosellana]|uniref:uncharacterized protein LOC129571494 n=1 Tax=Sitodiplosis mosellana TaxID=263140 RepID=UPI002443F185|nr:uncharacterized protein LOC129571494 [Sitodiplosis mosellana]
MQIKNLNGDIVAAKGIAWINLISQHDDTVNEYVGAYIVPKMMSNLPSHELDISKWRHLKGIKLADKTFHIPNKVDLLLGADFYSRVIINGIRKQKDAPTAQRTTFGWIVFGGYDHTYQHASIVNTIEGSVSNEQLLEMITKFWQQDQLPTKRYRTQEEQLCEDIFTNSITTNHEGRYIARMPLQPDAPKVIGSYDIAYARLMQMERKFARDPELKEKYIKFMRDYEELNHMSKVPPQEHHSDTAIYIPHHAAGTEKFRTVFDGSARAKNGISINDIQLNGEKVQPELITTLMRFRTHRIALTADVAKMYRQILIAEDQRDMQRILWRESPSQPVHEYRLNTQTYGNKSAAYVSIRTMAHMAEEFATEFPAASKAVKTSFYVDDALGGSHDITSAINLHRELIEMFGKRKMELAKWNTNDPTVRGHIKSSGCQLIELNKEETTAVLGMHWDAREDTFQYIIKNPIRLENPTKRSISSDKVEWDDKVEGEVLQRWEQFARELPNITNVRIPRWINTDLKSKKQLHAFADASKTGYGTTFYLRQQRDGDPVTVHLVFAKARVAPIKGSTIPKWELTACHLTAQLLEEVRTAHDVDIDSCTLWSDSMIALHWIGKSPAKLDVFVGNRVGEIQELTRGVEWKHVDTKSNPADLASRGISPTELADCKLMGGMDPAG